MVENLTIGINFKIKEDSKENNPCHEEERVKKIVAKVAALMVIHAGGEYKGYEVNDNVTVRVEICEASYRFMLLNSEKFLLTVYGINFEQKIGIQELDVYELFPREKKWFFA